MTNSIILENLNSEGLRDIIQGAVREELRVIQNSSSDKYLTRRELSEKLRISLPTLDKQIKLGNIKARRVGGRILFNESELNLSEIPIRKHLSYDSLREV